MGRLSVPGGAGPGRPSLRAPTELAEEGGRWPFTLLPLAEGRDMSVEPLGCWDEGGEEGPPGGGRDPAYGPGPALLL